MAKNYLKLQQSEGVVVLASAVLYGAYVQSGKISEGSESQYMERSVNEALQLAKQVEAAVVAEGEMG